MIEHEIVPMITEKEMDEKGFVHFTAWKETYSDLMPKEYLQNITLEKCIMMSRRFPQNTLLLKVDGKVVGFSCFSKIDDNTYEIVGIYLLKKYHGKKLGYSLMRATFDNLPNDCTVILWILKGNERAFNFYKRFGFELNGIEKSLPFGTEIQMQMINSLFLK